MSVVVIVVHSSLGGEREREYERAREREVKTERFVANVGGGGARGIFEGGSREKKGRKRQKQREREREGKKREREKRRHDVMRIKCMSG